MRLWSIHPRYLDARGLVALWREGLLAQNVLLGNTRGYTNHPQLLRFKNTGNQVGAVATYLRFVADEANRRGYNFDRRKIVNRRIRNTIAVTDGQLCYEFRHLLKKLKKRDPERYKKLINVSEIEQHPLFDEVYGDVESWEVT
jgi:hypothetical protein